MKERENDFWSTPFASSLTDSKKIRMPEMLFGYFIGPFGGLLASGIFTNMLQQYFTDVLKLDLNFLTSLQLASAILIVAANLIMGQLIERTKTFAGKARPWVLFSALIVSISSILMFIMPFQGVARMIWITIAYILFYAVAFPIYNTANATLLAVSTRDSIKRGTLASFTNMAGLGAMGTGAMVFPVLVSFILKDKQELWFVAMLGIAVLSALTILLQYKFTRERVTEENMALGKNIETREKTASFSRQFKAVTSEMWWWIIIVFYICFQWSGAMKNSSMAYFCKWVMDNSFFCSADAWGASQSLLGILGAIPMAVAALFVVPLANKYSKRVVVMLGMATGVLGGIIAGLSNGNIIGVAAGVALKCLGSAPASYLILAMLADVIDHIEFKEGIRTDGLTMSIYSSIMVAGTPICSAVFSAMLNGSGYNQNAVVGAAAQSAAARSMISIGYIWAETVAYAICAGLIFLWKVERKIPRNRGNRGRSE